MGDSQEYRFYDLLSAKLAGDATPKDLAQLQAMVEQNPQFQFLYDEVIRPARNEDDISHTRQVWASHYVKMMYATEDSAAEPLRAIKRPASKLKKLAYALLAAAAILAIVIGANIFFQQESAGSSKLAAASKNEMVTPKGSKSNLTLPDGTKVSLNADSKLSYDEGFAKGKREVTLNGEAYFDVVHDRSKPFIVHTGKADIKVLGTTFNVRNYLEDDYIEASLVKGKIEVTLLDQPDKKIILKPTEKLVVYKTGPNLPISAAAKKAGHSEIMTLTHVTINNSQVAEIMWMQNSMSFINKPLVEIARELQRQYNINVVFRSDKAKNYHYTIYLNNYSLYEAVEALKILKEFNYSINKNELIIE